MWSKLGVWDATAVYLIPLRQPEAPFRSLLSASEHGRANRFLFAPDRQAFTVSHGVTRQILADKLGTRPETLRFETNEHGKPRLVGRDLSFNLSHSGDYGLLAVSESEGDTRPCGIDIEQTNRAIKIQDIAPRYFSPAEQTELYALPPDQQTQAFFKLWTRKEAYIKACGLGLKIPLHDFDITIQEPVRLLRRAGMPDEPHRWQFHHLSLGLPSYIGALCLATQHKRP